MRKRFKWLWVILIVSATHSGLATGAFSAIRTGTWRASVVLPGGELPFLIELAEEDGVMTAYLVNGLERLRIGDVRMSDDSLTLFFPAYGNTIEAELVGGTLVGTLTLVKRGGVLQVMPFCAERGKEYLFFDRAPEPAMDVSGSWEMTFMTDGGGDYRMIGEFTQEGAHLTGTFLGKAGDLRYFAGDVSGSTMHLCCFDGSDAYLVRASLDDAGVLTGDFWAGTQKHRRMTGVRTERPELPDASTLTHLKEGYDRFTFAFPNLDGKTVSLEDKKFKNTVVIVTIGGTWCPNCHDEAVLLSKLHERYGPDGLRIVGLMYEHFRDFDRAALQVRRFRDKFEIEYDLLVAGYSDSKEAAKTLPMLDHIISYPTAIFIDRRGEVRKIHTGFNGPATGRHYDELVSDITKTIEELLAESS